MPGRYGTRRGFLVRQTNRAGQYRRGICSCGGLGFARGGVRSGNVCLDGDSPQTPVMSAAPVAPETPGIGDLQSVPVRHTADRRDGRNRDIRG